LCMGCLATQIRPLLTTDRVTERENIKFSVDYEISSNNATS